MHEMSVAAGILEIVEQEMGRRPGAKLLGFDIEIGEFSCVVEHSLAFCLEASLADSPWPTAQVRITTQPTQARCRNCQCSYTPGRYDFTCPECDQTDFEIISGKEICLKSLEIDE